MGTFLGCVGTPHIPEERQKEFRGRMLRLLREGGMMNTEEVNLFGKKISLLHFPEPDEDGLQTIIAEVPLAELANFTTFIRQTTQGRGWFTTEFARYETLPEMLVPAVVEQAKKLGNLDEAADD